MSGARYIPAIYTDRVVRRVVEEKRRETITEPAIVLELSLTEARLVQVLLGLCQAGGPTNPTYSRLDSVLKDAFGGNYHNYTDSRAVVTSTRPFIRLDASRLPPLEPRE